MARSLEAHCAMSLTSPVEVAKARSSENAISSPGFQVAAPCALTDHPASTACSHSIPQVASGSAILLVSGSVIPVMPEVKVP